MGRKIEITHTARAKLQKEDSIDKRLIKIGEVKAYRNNFRYEVSIKKREYKVQNVKPTSSIDLSFYMNSKFTYALSMFNT